ncbi:MAG TPA: hypothetical protein VN437_04995 [Rectinemataceae bacterium]|nr:hypothetical protein [Rectinemataceae bacterium]
MDIAFTRRENGGSDIYIKQHISLADVVTNLTNLPEGKNTEPAWSPNGATIAFVSTRDGNSEIYTMNRDGSNVLRRTNDDGIDMSPSFSPDGQRIAFISYRTGVNMNVFTMKTDGTDVVQVTQSPGTDASPCWSPDSLYILFVSNYEFTDGTNRLYLVGADGSNQHRFTSDTADEGDPNWNPVTNEIVYQRSDADAGSQIYRMDGDGTFQERLTDGTLADQGWHPSFSYDGMQLVFVSDRDGPPQLYTMNRDGTTVEQLTGNGAIDGQPNWSTAH